MKNLPNLLAIILITLLATACASQKAIEATTPEAVIAGVNVGDEINVTTRSGRMSHFVVTRMTNKALYGDGYRVTYGEMDKVEVKQKDGAVKRLGKKLF